LLRRFGPVLVFFATFFVCICIHETGHVLAGVLTGGRITEIALVSFTPHVRIAGECTPAVECVRAAAGSAFFLATYFAMALLLYRESEARRAASWFAVVELLGWVLSSAVSPTAMGPNDAAHFVEISGANRFLVAGMAAGIGIGGAALLRVLPRARVRTQPGIARRATSAAGIGK
jgi:hypothetical protein